MDVESPLDRESSQEGADEDQEPIFARSQFVWPITDDEADNHSQVYTLELRGELNEDEEDFFVAYHNVHATCQDQSSRQVVGMLVGALLTRPSRSFFQQADAVSRELQELAVLFCESNGVASRVHHPKLVNDAGAVQGGGFLNIEQVEIHPSYKHQDLGLRMVHEVLVLLRKKWSLAVIRPENLGPHFVHWPESNRLPPRPPGRRSQYTSEQLVQIQQLTIDLQRHFARIGFVQAGTNKEPNLVKCWFLTATMYFGNDPSPAQALSRWLTKEQAGRLEIHKEPIKFQASGLDKELADFLKFLQLEEGRPAKPVERRRNIAGNVATMDDLVRRGASIDNARAMHLASVLEVPEGEDCYALQTLVRLGGSVNQSDEYGNTPLNVAVVCMRVANIKYLLSVGADASIANMQGRTPIQSLQAKFRDMDDFRAAFDWSGVAPKAVDTKPMLEIFRALMPESQRSVLVDDWMSPRMHQALLITAETESDSCLDTSSSFPRKEYIPTDILQSESGSRSNQLVDGWCYLWQAMHEILQQGKAPTVSRIENVVSSQSASIQGYEEQKYQMFLLRGGRIEFAVDALLRITANVVRTGDDGWEYEMRKNAIEVHPPNPLDKCFDLAFFMCVDEGGGTLERRGPY